jgi:hypothetical protein
MNLFKKTPYGNVNGSVNGTGSGSGSVNGSVSGTGSVNGSVNGTVNGSVNGSVNGTGIGSVNGTGNINPPETQIGPCQLSIGCKNASKLNNNNSAKCVRSPELRELIKFYLTKDGCSGMGFFKNPKSIKINNTSLSFDQKELLTTKSILFKTPELIAALEIVANKTPFVSREQLNDNLIKYINKNIQQNSNFFNINEFHMKILNILLESIELKKETDLKLCIETLFNFYKLIIKNTRIVRNDEIVNLLYKLYNYICSSHYTNLNIRVPENMSIPTEMLTDFKTPVNVERHPLYTSQNLFNYCRNKGYITLTQVETQSGGAKKKKVSKTTLSTKTVDQLRKLMKKHGKKCSKDGKRYTKDQMIRILKRC